MMEHTEKIIGGKFGLPVALSTCDSAPGFLAGNPLCLFNGRSGIKLVVDQLKPRTVWLPSYLCPTIVSSVDTNTAKIRYYPMDTRLNLGADEFIKEISPDDLFLFIDYFGFSFDPEQLQSIKKQGCKLLRDCSQNLFFDVRGDRCDFQLFSPRKFLGVPDGGILHHPPAWGFDPFELEQPDQEALYLMTLAVIERREFDLYGGEKTWNAHFHAGEAQFTPGKRSMSDIARLLLNHAFDYQQIKEQRRKNFCVLLNSLQDMAIFKALPGQVVPLGFPIRHENRDELQLRLFEKNIFPPIHWDINQTVPGSFSESQVLSREILTIPCDQRYDEEDMQYIIHSILEF